MVIANMFYTLSESWEYVSAWKFPCTLMTVMYEIIPAKEILSDMTQKQDSETLDSLVS